MEYSYIQKVDIEIGGSNCVHKSKIEDLGLFSSYLTESDLHSTHGCIPFWISRSLWIIELAYFLQGMEEEDY